MYFYIKSKSTKQSSTGSGLTVVHFSDSYAFYASFGSFEGRPAKAMVPITKEEWEKKQGEITRVFDSTTGRSR